MGRSSELDGLTTLPELLMQSIQKNGDREALRQYDRATGKWESWTYKERASTCWPGAELLRRWD